MAALFVMCFHHDAAPSRYIRPVVQHLNDTSPNRWIGRGSKINWPQRSPDLTPVDFCLWSWMKGEVYSVGPHLREQQWHCHLRSPTRTAYQHIRHCEHVLRFAQHSYNVISTVTTAN